jgi:hypothetical protein
MRKSDILVLGTTLVVALLAVTSMSTPAFPQSGCTPAATPTPTPTSMPTPTATRTPIPGGPLTVLSPASGGNVTCQMVVSVAMQPPGYLTYFYIDNVYQNLVLDSVDSAEPSVTIQPLPLSKLSDGQHILGFVATDGQNQIVAESAQSVTFDLAAWRALPHNACTSSSPSETCTDGCISGPAIITQSPSPSPTPVSTPTPTGPSCTTVAGYPGVVCGTPCYCGDACAPAVGTTTGGQEGAGIRCPSGAQLWGGACIFGQTPSTAIYVPPASC